MEELLLRLGVSASLIETLQLGLLARLLLAAVLGGAIGLEREISRKPAGLRTNLLICVGAALLTELSIGLAVSANAESEAAGSLFRADPGRIAAQIVSGIGFLGAGTILQARGSITGLTTAATIWVVAAIGMAVGTRAYIEAAGTALLVVVALVLLGRLEGYFTTHRRERSYILSIDPDPALLEEVEHTFRDAGLRVEARSVEKGGGQYQLSVDAYGPARLHEKAVRALLVRPGVHGLTSS